MTEKEKVPWVKPFNMGYTLRKTIAHMYKSINISISNTFNRSKEFAGNPEKTDEIFKTLSFLHQMRKSLEDLETAFPDHFKSK